MSKIRIKNFGPIKEGYQENGGFLDIKKVTVFIGNQGSGKSTVAKVISTMMWIEKALNRGDFSIDFTFHDLQEQFEYQNLRDYFNLETVIDYVGERYSIHYDMYSNQWPIIEKTNESNYVVPKIMYIPSERNFLSVINNATGVRGLPEPLFEFAEELKRGQADTKGEEIPLPINGVSYKYESGTDTSYIIGTDYKLNLLYASSGFQSLVPLFLVSSSLAQMIKSGVEISSANISVDQSIRMNKEISKITLDNKISDDEKLKKVSDVKARFQNKAFINIVEETEQNLFPSSQHQILNHLLEFNNMNEGNKLIITTHSPYLINYLTLAVKAESLIDKCKGYKGESDFKTELSKIVSLDSLVKANDLVIYELNDSGNIIKLGNYKGLPEDKNYLNNSLAETNYLFDDLLQLEKQCQ